MSDNNLLPRINDQILRFFNDLPRAREVRLISEDGEQQGIVAAAKALEMAKNLNLDLIEIAPHANPPVCKILDYGKYKYQMSKKQKENQASAKQVDMKTLTLGIMIEDHDFNVKVNSAIKFLKHGDKVKVLIKFRGREITYPEYAENILNRIISAVSDISNVEKQPVLDGKSMIMILAPKN